MDDTRTMRTVLIVIAAVIAAVAILGLMTDKNGGIGSRRTDNLSTYTTGGTAILPEAHSEYTYPQSAAAPNSAQLQEFQQALSNEAYLRGIQLGRAVEGAQYGDEAYMRRIQLGR